MTYPAYVSYMHENVGRQTKNTFKGFLSEDEAIDFAETRSLDLYGYSPTWKVVKHDDTWNVIICSWNSCD